MMRFAGHDSAEVTMGRLTTHVLDTSTAVRPPAFAWCCAVMARHWSEVDDQRRRAHR